MKVIKENKPLNEGIDNSCTISGILRDVHVNNIKLIKPNGTYSNGRYYLVEVDATATFGDVEATGRWFGITLDKSTVQISEVGIFMENNSSPTEQDIKDCINRAKIYSQIKGDGTRNTFNGVISVGENNIESPFDELDSIEFRLTNKQVIERINEILDEYVNKKSMQDESLNNKPLNEGPGAGYTIESSGYRMNGTLVSVSASSIRSQKDTYEFDCEVDLTGTVDKFEANAYYSGTGEVNDLPISCTNVVINLTNSDLEGIVNTEEIDSDNINSDNINKEELLNLIIDALMYSSYKYTYGGGWSHSDFDGSLTDGEYDLTNDYYEIWAGVQLSNPSDIEKVDRMTSGYGYTTEYAVMDEEDDVVEMFEDKEEAIEYAKTNGHTSVVEVTTTNGWDEDDFEQDFGDTVWESGVDESIKKPLKESFSEEDRAQALANYLGIDVSEVSNTYDYEFETPEGDYFVVDEDEAYDLVKEDIENFIDEMGITGFTPNFQEWIIDNALDKDEFESAVRESMESYVDDIEGESSDEGFDSRLIEEMYHEGFITDEDFEEDENGDPDYLKLKDDFDYEDAKMEFTNVLVDNAGDPVQYCISNFGEDFVTDMVKNNSYLMDIDSVVNEAISLDGVAHFLARYDGDEHDLGDGLYAYRTN